jgi:hypothetical protein
MENEMTGKRTDSCAENFLQLSAEELTELERRLPEDDATPDDTTAWETIKAEAQTRRQQ